MAYDAEFYDGFDKYGPTGYAPVLADLVGEWTSFTGGATMAVVASLVGAGQAIKFSFSDSTAGFGLGKTFGGNYARMVGGLTLSAGLAGSGSQFFITFGDAGVDQLSISLNVAGQFEIRRGAATGTLLGTTTQTVATGAPHCLEWDVTIHSSTGIVKLWLDGIATSISLTGQNTRSTTNNYLNTMRLGGQGLGAIPTPTVDHLYCWLFTAAGGAETPALTNPIIETQFPASDSAVTFAPGAGVLGQAYRITTATSAPGANRLSLRKFTPAVNCTLNSVEIVPAATSATAKFKGVVYADSSGAAGALLSSGTEVVGATSGAPLVLPLVTPQALTAGTQYWIGYITDTSLAVQQYDGALLGYGAANTYASGAPGPAPAMTAGQASWLIWGNVTGLAVNWPEVSANPALGDLSYVGSSTLSAEDLFTMPGLVSAPTTIYSSAVKARVERTDAGARTLNLEQKSGAVTAAGNAGGQTPSTAYGWLGSYFDTDPNTGAAWTASGVNNAKAGYKIAT